MLRRSPRRAVPVLVAALVAVAALAGPARAAVCPEGIGVGLLGGGDSADPRARSYVVDAVDPGEAFSRRFQVCNGTDQDVTVELYAGAAAVEDGAFRVLEGRVRSELTGWVRIEPGTVTIPARQAAVATARFRVPEGVQDGERYGALLVALPGRAQGGVDVVSRVGVRVYLAVGDARRTDFTVESLQPGRDADGRPVLRATVRNTGQRALDPRGELVLTEGPGTTRAGPFPVSGGTTVAPGGQTDGVVPLDAALSRGPWRAVLTLRAGGVERRAAAVVTFPDSGQGVVVPARELEGRGGTVLAAGGLVLALATVVLGLLLLARRRRRAAGPVPAPVAVPVLAPAPLAAALPPLPVIPAPRSAAVRRALAQRSGGAAGAVPADAP